MRRNLIKLQHMELMNTRKSRHFVIYNSKYGTTARACALILGGALHCPCACVRVCVRVRVRVRACVYVCVRAGG